MEELAGNACIFFEGNLSDLRLLHIEGASHEPTSALKRNTLSPKQDFIVVPLEPHMVEEILAAIGGAVPRNILHIQIEKDGMLHFGAYDNFHPETSYFGSEIAPDFVERLVSHGILRLQ